MILVDSCVLIDVLENDARWADWPQRQLEAASLAHPLIINPVIYAELTDRFDRIEDANKMLDTARIALKEIPREALFLAGKAFQSYRKRGGTRTGTLPDFFIGAHAAVLGVPLLTRDADRYGGYFPRLELIRPGKG